MSFAARRRNIGIIASRIATPSRLFVTYARAINAQKRVTKSRVGVAIRDAMMPMFLRRAANDTRNDWLYNHTVG